MRWLMPAWYAIAAVACGSVATPAAWADGPGLVVQRVDAAQFPTVRVSVSVANGNGVPITGLDTQAFQLQEDGRPVEDLAVEPIVNSQEPIAIALVIDTSGSMADESKIDNARNAAATFIDALGSADRATIVSFADQVALVQDYSKDKAALKAAIAGLTAGGNTLLYDAVAQTGHRQAAQVERRRALILLTDGEDTRSAASLEASIAAATSAASPVYAIGLGSDVNKDVLRQLASASGGQSVFVTDPGQLQATFLSIGDQLRRQYVLRYTSKLTPNAKPHGVAVQVTYSGQSATGLGSFSPPATPAAWTVSGLTASGPVTGIQHIGVDAPGGAQLGQLLVDDQVRATTSNVPFQFDWDASRESVGTHRVVVRVTDSQSILSDKAYSITVAAPPATPIVALTPAPVATPAPTSVPASVAQGADSRLLSGIALLLLLVSAGIVLLVIGRKSKRSDQPTPRQAAPPPPTDMTEEVGSATGVADMTFVRPRADGRAPRARLRITRRGEEHEVQLDETEATVGRDDSVKVPIKDPQASRKHARIFRKDSTFWVEDLESLNGTQVNGENVKCRQLASKDRIGIGETVLTLVIDPPTT
ncbi:MAG: VWA domain-containing protein [Chloroflexota bacterium]